MKKSRFAASTLVALLLAMPTALFANGGADKGSGSEAAEVRELVVWTVEDQDNYIDPILMPVAAAVEAAYPGSKVSIEQKPLDDIKLTLKLALTSNDSPDVTQVNQGVGELGLYADSGLLMDMTSFAAQNGWNDRLSASTLKAANYPADNIYGVSTNMELVGCFYNKDLFVELGVTVPQTFAEFEALLAKVKTAGYTPLNFGNLDGWPGIHYYSAVQHILLGREELDGMMTHAPGSSWDVDGNRDAAAVMQDWVAMGYFTENFSGISYDDSLVVFNQGESAIWITGNWMSGDLVNSPFEVGFFALPADDPAKLKAIGGASLPFTVAANTDQADLAKAFLDELTKATTGDNVAAASLIPSMKTSTPARSGSGLETDLLANNDAIRAANGLGWYIDWATPTFYDTVTGALQQVFSGSITPETFAEALQKDYAQY